MPEKENQRIPESGRRMRLAHAYIPWQHFKNSYPPAEALRKGNTVPRIIYALQARQAGLLLIMGGVIMTGRRRPDRINLPLLKDIMAHNFVNVEAVLFFKYSSRLPGNVETA